MSLGSSLLLLRTSESCAESDRIQDEALPGMLELNSTTPVRNGPVPWGMSVTASSSSCETYPETESRCAAVSLLCTGVGLKRTLVPGFRYDPS